MKNRGIYLLLAMVLTMSMMMPVFAETPHVGDKNSVSRSAEVTMNTTGDHVRTIVDQINKANKTGEMGVSDYTHSTGASDGEKEEIGSVQLTDDELPTTEERSAMPAGTDGNAEGSGGSDNEQGVSAVNDGSGEDADDTEDEEKQITEDSEAEEMIDDSEEPVLVSEEVLVDVDLVAIGKGRLICSDDGSIECKPGKGCEVVSITADKDAENISAGDQIPEREIGDISFLDGTTITAKFEKIDEEDMQTEAPASAAAVFG